MPHIQPLNDALSLDTYADQKTVSFTIIERRTSGQAAKAEVQIPLSIAYRLFFLGRAFDCQAIKFIEPRGSTQIDFIRLQVLISELELIARAVSDPVSQHYLKLLLPLLKGSCGDTACCLNVVAS
jgi:hypothetical protein